MTEADTVDAYFTELANEAYNDPVNVSWQSIARLMFARAKELEIDAKRWKWAKIHCAIDFRQHRWIDSVAGKIHTKYPAPCELDDAIDAAIRALSKEPR